MDRRQFIRDLEAYNTTDQKEKSFIPMFHEMLVHPDAFLRSHLPGHMTSSTWILDTSKKFVLLTHHAKLNKWLQPGGHADGDEDLLAVALREAEEETGLKGFSLIQPGIFDIDIHTIPAGKDFPEHLHYDLRFLLQTNRYKPLILSAESHALAWIPLTDVGRVSGQNSSMIRMTDKVNSLFGTYQ